MKFIDNIDIDYYTDFILQNDYCTIFQSPEWTQIKDNWDSKRVGIVDNNNNLLATAQILIRKGMWYLPRGPLLNYDDVELLNFFLKNLVNNAKENKAKLPTIAAEFIGWNNGERLVTGKDPLTGEDANRWAAGAELAFDIASNFYPVAKAGKLRKLEKALDAVDAVNDASKATKVADKASDVARVADKVDDVKDGTKALTGQEIANDFVKNLDDITKSGSIAKNYQSSGGYAKALEDFNSLNLENVKDISTVAGPGKVGNLPDGTKVVVRPTSKEGIPTLEFQFKAPYKIRY